MISLIKRLKEPTLVESGALFQVAQQKKLREIRRELRRLERRQWWMRIRAKLHL